MKKRYTFLSFLIPLIFMILILISNGVIFGKMSIFYGDSQYQYQTLVIFLKNVLEGVTNWKYSYQICFSTPMIATFAYYLTTPFNILLYFFDNIENFYIFQILLKISLCGLTMYKYLTYENKNHHALIFSTSYALSSYIMCNYFQMMWLDAYLLAPLLLLGIDKIINEKKFLLYSITLFIIIFSNYYMGYMCGVFAVIYFIYKYILSNKKDSNIIKMFLITSILSGLMTMFLHIPNLIELSNVERIDFRNYLFNFDFLGIFSKLYLGSSVGDMNNEYHPYIYIGIFNIILLVFYFINKNINKKEKILSFIFLFILIISIIFEPLNNFWHALSNPIGVNYRYIYLFNILIISLCYKSFLEIKYINKKYYLIIFISFLILSIFVYIRNLFNVIYLIISIMFFIVYLIMLKIENKDLKILFNFLAIAEIFFNGYLMLDAYQFTDRYYINGVYNEKTSSINMIDDNSFYRMEFNKKFGFNDSLNYNYNGVAGWVSSSKIDIDFYNKIGYFGITNMGFYNDSILLDSLFGIKYYESIYQNKYYDLIDTNKVSVLDGMFYGISYTDSYIYKNPYALSLGYMVSSNSKQHFICEDGFDCQNTMLNNMIGYNNDVFEVYEVKDKFKITSDKDFYILIQDEVIDSSYNICIDDICRTIVFPSNRVIFIENNYNIGDEINITIDKNNTVKSIQIAYIDINKFVENYNKLQNNQLKITSFKEDNIRGIINVEDNKTLFLSIQYHENFKILVDGKETKYFKIFDNFIGLDLEEGYHQIEIIYEIKGLKLGIVISLVSFYLFLIYSIKQYNKNIE